MSRVEIGDLADFMELGHLEVRNGAIAIEDFAAKHRQYVELDADGRALSFCSEDLMFVVHHDLDERLRVVFGGTIRAFCPKTDLFVSEYRSTIEEVVADLRDAYGTIFHKRQIQQLGRLMKKVPLRQSPIRRVSKAKKAKPSIKE